jgi:YD repeat-containing protein
VAALAGGVHTVDQTNAGYTSDVDYVYDATGNVKSITDNAGGKDTQCHARLNERSRHQKRCLNSMAQRKLCVVLVGLAGRCTHPW